MDILEKQHEKLISLQQQYNEKVATLMEATSLNQDEREHTHIILNILDCLIKFIDGNEAKLIAFIKRAHELENTGNVSDGLFSELIANQTGLKNWQFINSDIECAWCGKHSEEAQPNMFALDPRDKDKFLHTCPACYLLRGNEEEYNGLTEKTWLTLVE